uniref:Uncharacterized protein n=1 Tax=Lepeophtheirus salmonis TaxID=72036 RepID=A0A0K2SV44_LEPSM
MKRTFPLGSTLDSTVKSLLEFFKLAKTKPADVPEDTALSYSFFATSFSLTFDTNSSPLERIMERFEIKASSGSWIVNEASWLFVEDGFLKYAEILVFAYLN